MMLFHTINCSAGELLKQYATTPKPSDAVMPTPTPEQILQLTMQFPEVQLGGGIYWAARKDDDAVYVWVTDGWDWARRSEPFVQEDGHTIVPVVKALRLACEEACIETEDEFWLATLARLASHVFPDLVPSDGGAL